MNIPKMNDTIYLIQPAELIGTNRYKIGRSSQTDLARCKKGYKKGTEFICIMSCMESEILENKIKAHFNKTFKLIAGREYYEGDENSILNEFLSLTLAHRSQRNQGHLNGSCKLITNSKYYEEEEIKETKNTAINKLISSIHQQQGRYKLCNRNKLLQKKIHNPKPKLPQKKICKRKPTISQNKAALIKKMKILTLPQLREIADDNDIYGCKTTPKQVVINKLMDNMTQKDLNESIKNL
jgi:hypothetical protein